MEKQREEGLDVGGEANKSELEGAIKSGDDDKKPLGFEDSENNADGVKDAHAVYALTPGKPTIPDDDDKIKHPRPKARPHKADSDNGEEEEDSENADDDDTDDEMHEDDHDNVDDEYGDWFMSQLKKRPDLPSSEAFPASLLSYVQETHCHDRPPSTNTVLVYILEDEEGLARDNSYPVWEMERQKRKMKLERVSVSYSNLMKAECCLAIIDRMERKSRGN